jgi:hypothetical protein
MNAMFLKDLAIKTHRGLKGRALADNPPTPLASSKSSRTNNHTIEPEPPMLKPL